jgi:hypothetical protein
MAAKAWGIEFAIAEQIALMVGAKAVWLCVWYRPRILQRVLEVPYVFLQIKMSDAGSDNLMRLHAQLNALLLRFGNKPGPSAVGAIGL